MNISASISLKHFVNSSLLVSVLTLVYLAAPNWLSHSSIDLSKNIVIEMTSTVFLKLSLSSVFICAGLLGVLCAGHSNVKSERFLAALHKATVSLQNSGGAFFGWGLGFFLYALLSEQYEQLPLCGVVLGYLALVLLYPMLIAEQTIIMQRQSARFFPNPRDLAALKYQATVSLIGGIIMICGICFFGW